MISDNHNAYNNYNNYIDELISKYWFLTNDIKNKNIYYPLEGYLFPGPRYRQVFVNSLFDCLS
jgi:hypothetical protein